MFPYFDVKWFSNDYLAEKDSFNNLFKIGIEPISNG